MKKKKKEEQSPRPVSFRDARKKASKAAAYINSAIALFRHEDSDLTVVRAALKRAGVLIESTEVLVDMMYHDRKWSAQEALEKAIAAAAAADGIVPGETVIHTDGDSDDSSADPGDDQRTDCPSWGRGSGREYITREIMETVERGIAEYARQLAEPVDDPHLYSRLDALEKRLGEYEADDLVPRVGFLEREYGQRLTNSSKDIHLLAKDIATLQDRVRDIGILQKQGSEFRARIDALDERVGGLADRVVARMEQDARITEIRSGLSTGIAHRAKLERRILALEQAEDRYRKELGVLNQRSTAAMAMAREAEKRGAGHPRDPKPPHPSSAENRGE